MTTHATSGKQWTESELDSLSVENQFRLRGLEVTRLDTFIDAAFAFVLTLLVISFDEIPSNYDEMLTAAKRVPAFAASFAILMMFWLPHRRWSRRYGLENSKTVLLSLTLIFVVLVYVYPLRMIFEEMFSGFSGGYLPSTFSITSYHEARVLLVFFSVGFFALSLIFNRLYSATLHSTTMLALNEIELRFTRINMQAWTLAASVALLVILLTLTAPDAWIRYVGYPYFSLFFVARLPAYLDRRRHGDPESAA